GPHGGVPPSAERPANRATLPPTGIAPEVGQIVNKGASVSVCSQNTLSRSSPRRRVPSPRPWIPAISAFTRVFDALCAGMDGVLLQHAGEERHLSPVAPPLTPVRRA